MRISTRSALIAILAVAPLTVAWTNRSDGALTLSSQSRLWFDGTSTVRAFTCAADLLEADVATITADVASAVAAGQKAISAAMIRVPVAKLNCGNGKMNDHMLKALKVRENPVITYTVSSYELTKVEATMQATLTGTLSLGGVEKPVTVVATAKEEGGKLRVTGAHVITMSDFGIKAPTLMMNTIKVGNEVTVRFDLLLEE